MLVLLALAPTGLAATINVAAGSSIQDAIDVANDGDVIVIAPGTYEENLEIDVRVELMGSGVTKPVIYGDGWGYCIEIYADGVQLEGLNINQFFHWHLRILNGQYHQELQSHGSLLWSLSRRGIQHYDRFLQLYIVRLRSDVSPTRTAIISVVITSTPTSRPLNSTAEGSILRTRFPKQR